MSLADKLNIDPKRVLDSKRGPVWEGPEGTGPQGGVSQSLLGKFLSCRDRFRVHVFDSLQAAEGFSPAMEYGNFWHRCEEAVGNGEDWRTVLADYCRGMADRYPMDREKVSHWYNMCLEQFPIYLDFYATEKEEVGRTRLLAEQVFDVPYTLPYSKRTVRLRGKWDGISMIDTYKTSPATKRANKRVDVEQGTYLDENKTKSTIDQVKIGRQLKFDLQTMMYLITLQLRAEGELARDLGIDYLPPIKGVRYNVIRRSAHKSPESMVKKIQEDIDDNRGGEWFGRWTVEISQQDIDTFKRTCLDPVLEQLCLWWDVINGNLRHVNAFTLRDIMHWRHPHGVYNPVDETGGSNVDSYLETGSTVGLKRVTELFPELVE